MQTKREILISGTLAMFFGGCCSCNSADAAIGCSLSISAAAPYIKDIQDAERIRDPFVLKSGNRDFDFATAQSLSRMSEVFKVLPSFRYFKFGNSDNAFATPIKIDQGRDGSILFGRDLLFKLMAKEEGPETAFAAVLAHEYGHILQFKLGINNILQQQAKNVRASELHADFLSGYFAGIRKLEMPDFKAAIFAVNQYSVGDYEASSNEHHGTPEERARSVVMGFKTAYNEKLPLMDAVLFGAKYVLSI